jgi:hypothetical protein
MEVSKMSDHQLIMFALYRILREMLSDSAAAGCVKEELKRRILKD